MKPLASDKNYLSYLHLYDLHVRSISNPNSSLFHKVHICKAFSPHEPIQCVFPAFAYLRNFFPNAEIAGLIFFDPNLANNFLGLFFASLMALFFGLIHGMDFSNYFKALIMSPDEIVIPLLGFNIGIELGQLLIVLFIVLISFLLLI